MILIGILTAMILPEMKGTFEEALLRSSSRELVNVFDLAYSRAVSLNREHRVHFEPRTGRYWIETKDRANAPEFVPLRDVPGAQGKLDSRVTLQVRQLSDGAEDSPQDLGGSPQPVEPPSITRYKGETLTFHPDGTADAGEVILRDRDGFRLALRLNPITARVRVLEIARE
jgi:type II secretory pathway pseudopilin PulG